MKIEPTYTNLKSMFASQATYYVPTYQRAYAWENEAIKDYLNDLNTCYKLRLSGTEIQHFFGGVLSIKNSINGTIDKHHYEVIDGQQRVTTFTITIRCIIDSYEKLKFEIIDSDHLSGKIAIITKRINSLSERFIEFIQEINLEETVVKVFTTSKRDKDFYSELMKGNILDQNPERHSHQNLLNTYNKIGKFLKDTLDVKNTIEEKLEVLQTLEFVLDNDFTLLHMVADSKKSAYRLFQVINDRGVSLTEGDLLRAKTLELLENYPSQQASSEILWDKILSNNPNITSKYLTWIYLSQQGKNLKNSELYDKFLDDFFPEHKKDTLVSSDADKILKTIQSLSKKFQYCHKLSRGEWVHQEQAPIVGWDRARLELLMNTLDHDMAMPLLISATQLDHKIFSSLVHMIERVFFRYKTICKQSVSLLQTIYFNEIKKINLDPTKYTLDTFKIELNKLLDSKATNLLFSTNLKELKYDIEQGNRNLKYFLMTMEYYFPWFLRSPTDDAPKCNNKSHIYDFSGTSIEHIYPKNALAIDLDASAEPVKNSIGNLALMDPKFNSDQGNKPFSDKKDAYTHSSIEVLKHCSISISWSLTEISKLEEEYIKLALKYFRA